MKVIFALIFLTMFNLNFSSDINIERIESKKDILNYYIRTRQPELAAKTIQELRSLDMNFNIDQEVDRIERLTNIFFANQIAKYIHYEEESLGFRNRI